MGEIYDLTYDDVMGITQEIIENNVDLKNWCQEDVEIKKVIESIFYIEDIGGTDAEFLNGEDGFFGIGTKASLYLRNSKHHICAKDIVIDFIKILFSQQGWKCIKDIYCKFTNIPSENVTPTDLCAIIAKIKEAIVKNVIKLNDENFCIYLQMVTHFKEHGRVMVQEVVDWIPDFMGKCTWEATEWKCQFCECEKCTLKGKDDYEKIITDELKKMAEDRLLLPAINENGVYKINY